MKIGSEWNNKLGQVVEDMAMKMTSGSFVRGLVLGRISGSLLLGRP